MIGSNSSARRMRENLHKHAARCIALRLAEASDNGKASGSASGSGGCGEGVSGTCRAAAAPRKRRVTRHADAAAAEDACRKGSANRQRQADEPDDGGAIGAAAGTGWANSGRRLWALTCEGCGHEISSRRSESKLRGNYQQHRRRHCPSTMQPPQPLPVLRVLQPHLEAQRLTFKPPLPSQPQSLQLPPRPGAEPLGGSLSLKRRRRAAATAVPPPPGPNHALRLAGDEAPGGSFSTMSLTPSAATRGAAAPRPDALGRTAKRPRCGSRCADSGRPPPQRRAAGAGDGTSSFTWRAMPQQLQRVKSALASPEVTLCLRITLRVFQACLTALQHSVELEWQMTT